MKDNESLSFNFSIHVEIDNYVEFDPYHDNYFQYIESSIKYTKSSKERNIGKIELIYLHGNRAYNNDLDIVDICDSESQELYDYARSIYKNGYILIQNTMKCRNQMMF